MRHLLTFAMLLPALLLLADCQSEPVQVVDLNRVLDLLIEELEQPAADVEAPATIGEDMPAIDEDAEKTNRFLQGYARRLNEAQLIPSTIGVHMLANGAIEGFIDVNGNGFMDGGDERHLFEVQIDAAGSRLIASDKSGDEHYHRDRGYTYRPGGFFMGYMLGSMMSRQNGFAASSGVRPNFGSMQMSPANYHSQAVSRAKATSSARSRAGSGGFRGGK